MRKKYTEQGDQQALDVAQALLESQQNISLGDKERLFGYLEGSGKIILPEPMALLTPASKMPGLDGQKMSKSYRNTISLREDPDDVSKKLRTMPTDPALKKGLFIQPVIFTGLTGESRLVREEIFGPVLPEARTSTYVTIGATKVMYCGFFRIFCHIFGFVYA